MEKTTTTPSNTGRYRVRCRYCSTTIIGTAERGLHETVAAAAKALAGHVKHHCEKAPPMPSRWFDRVVAASIEVVE